MRKKQTNTKESLTPEQYQRFLKNTNEYKKDNYDDIRLRVRRDGKNTFSDQMGPFTKEDIKKMASAFNLSVNELIFFALLRLREETLAHSDLFRAIFDDSKNEWEYEPTFSVCSHNAFSGEPELTFRGNNVQMILDAARSVNWPAEALVTQLVISMIHGEQP